MKLEMVNYLEYAELITYVTAKERLPTNLGWKRPENIITGLKFGTLQAKLAGVRKNIFPLPDNFQQANV